MQPHVPARSAATESILNLPVSRNRLLSPLDTPQGLCLTAPCATMLFCVPASVAAGSTPPFLPWSYSSGPLAGPTQQLPPQLLPQEAQQRPAVQLPPRVVRLLLAPALPPSLRPRLPWCCP